MLPRQNRLKKKEIEKVLREGKTFRSVFLILKIVKADKRGLTGKGKESVSRFAVIVPIRVAKKAAKRNKLRRQIRESLRKKLQLIKPGWDGVFLSLPEALKKDYWHIDREVNKLLIKSEILNPKY